MSMHNPAHPGEILKELLIEPLERELGDVAGLFGLEKILHRAQSNFRKNS